MSVKTLVISVLALLALVQSLISIDTIGERRADLRNSRMLLSRVDHARDLIEAVLAMSRERGRTNLTLRAADPPRKELTALRAETDARMAAVLGWTDTKGELAPLRALWSKVLEQRSIIDHALATGTPAPGRAVVNRAIADSWLAVASMMVKTLDDTLFDSWYLEEDISREGRNLWILVTNTARLRVAAGQDAATVVGEVMSPTYTSTPGIDDRDAAFRGAIEEIWRDLRHAIVPFQTLVPLVQDIEILYWRRFQALRHQAIQERRDAILPPARINELIDSAKEALNAISRLSTQAGEDLKAQASAQLAVAQRALAMEYALMTAYLALVALVVCLLHFRITRPLVAMTEKLARARAKTQARSPANATRPRSSRDEVRRLADAVDDYIATLTALGESEERFRLSTEAARDGIWDWDFRTGQLWFSPRWKEQLGYADADFPNTVEAWESVIFPEDRDKALAAVEDYTAGRIPTFDMVQRFRHRTGHVVHIHSRAIQQKDTDGTVIRMVGAHTDITAQVAHEAELTAARERAEAANKAKSSFLAVVSHELRTPLTGILGTADMMLATPPSARWTHWLSVLRGSGAALLDLVNGILDYSKIDAGYLTLEILNHDPVAIAAEVIESLRPQARRKGLDLTLDAQAVGMRAGDPTKLRQILLNLVGNAIKFTDSGRVNVFISPNESATPDGRPAAIRFEVWDTGIGMTPEQRERLFQPFTQVDESTTRRHGGTGLGLVICQRLCQAMGGSVTCDSAPGDGTHFTVTLPLPVASARFPTLEPPPMDGLAAFDDLPPLSLLIAEDNETNRLLLKEILSGMGHRLTVVENGAEAVRATETRSFDLAIMDMQMPIMDGQEAASHIRGQESLGREGGRPRSRMPMIALTADINAKESLGEKANLFDAFLTKPIDWPLLAATLAALSSEQARVPPSPRATASEAKTGTTAQLPADWRDRPIFDQGWIDEMAGRVPGDRIAAILRSLEGRLKQPLAPLRLAMETDDDESVARLCHALRGLAGQFGLTRVAILADTLERIAKTGHLEEAPPLLPTLDAEIDAAARAIAEKLKVVAVA